MELEIALLTSCFAALVGVLPSWAYSRGWGYGPAGVIAVVLLVLALMTLTGHVPA